MLGRELPSDWEMWSFLSAQRWWSHVWSIVSSTREICSSWKALQKSSGEDHYYYQGFGAALTWQQTGKAGTVKSREDKRRVWAVISIYANICKNVIKKMESGSPQQCWVIRSDARGTKTQVDPFEYQEIFSSCCEGEHRHRLPWEVVKEPSLDILRDSLSGGCSGQPVLGGPAWEALHPITSKEQGMVRRRKLTVWFHTLWYVCYI